MARTVGLPVALAAAQVLAGKVHVRGVRGPTAEEGIWSSVLSGLEERGLGMREGTPHGKGMESVLVRGLLKTLDSYA